jgi:hypothetical protein
MTTVIALVACGMFAAAACSTTSEAPDHGGADARADAPPAFDAGVDGGLDAVEDASVCYQAADCPSGQICCGTEAMTTACQAGPCPALPAGGDLGGGPAQLCATAAECFVAGDICAHLCITGFPINFCFDPALYVSCYGRDIASDAALDASGDGATADTGADADTCPPSGCTGACLSSNTHNVATLFNGCLVWECCVPDDAGPDASAE